MAGTIVLQTNDKAQTQEIDYNEQAYMKLQYFLLLA